MLLATRSIQPGTGGVRENLCVETTETFLRKLSEMRACMTVKRTRGLLLYRTVLDSHQR